MAKRTVLNVDDYAKREDPPVTESVGEEPQATLYCRCPLSLAVRLRTLAFERSKGKRRRVTQNDLLIEAIERFLNTEGIQKLTAMDWITMAEVIERALDQYVNRQED